MGKYDSQLNDLFVRWKLKSLENNEKREPGENGNVIFTEDGILKKADNSIDVEKNWENSTKRILFILKDQPSEWSNDMRLWLKREDNQQLKSRFIRNIANIFWGLYNAGYGRPLPFYDDLINASEDVIRCFNTQPFALMESKKQGGGTSISDTVLRSYIERYADFLKEEIRILQPNMIVCTGGSIYHFVCEMYPQEELQTIKGHNSIRYHQKSDTLIFASFHPSAVKHYDVIYDGVMEHYRAFLNSPLSNNSKLR